MTRMWLIASLCALAGRANAAQPTHFAIKPITVGASSDVFVTAINDRSMIAGTYASSGQAYGFTLAGTNVTTLPFNCDPYAGTLQCVPVPSAVNHLGLVAGSAGNTSDFEPVGYFTWQATDPALTILFNSVAAGQVLLSEGDDIAIPCYTYNNFHQVTQCGVFEGPVSSYALVGGLNDDAVAQSLSRGGTMAGVQPLTLRGKSMIAGFTVHAGKVHTVVPHDAANVYGVVVNDHLQLAGSYVDIAGLWHAFTRQDGRTTLFDMPTHAIFIAVTGENNAGRVVGYYEDEHDAIYPFLYNGAASTKMRDQPFGGRISVLINDEGIVILSDGLGGTPPYGSKSYRVLCAGPGC